LRNDALEIEALHEPLITSRSVYDPRIDPEQGLTVTLLTVGQMRLRRSRSEYDPPEPAVRVDKVEIPNKA
jgi:hypothetical protein